MIKIVFKKRYFYWFLIIFLLYLILSVLISGFYKTIPLILTYADTVNWIKLGISLFLTLVIGFLVALNGVLVYIKYRERKKCRGVGTTTIGVFLSFVRNSRRTESHYYCRIGYSAVRKAGDCCGGRPGIL